MKLSPGQAKAKVTDPRLDVEQASFDQIAHAVEVAQAPSSDAAFDLLDSLAGQQERRLLLDACRATNGAAQVGHDTIQARLARGALPSNWGEWVERCVALEMDRISAAWDLSDHDAARTPAAEVERADPSALASRLMTPAFRRVGSLDVPHGAWYVRAMAEVDRHGPGWDTSNLKAALKALVAGAVHARYEDAAAQQQGTR